METETRNPRTGATIRRVSVEVNGKRIDDIDRNALIVVVPTGYSSTPIRESLIELGYQISTEWIDGTGTITLVARAGPRFFA